MAEPRALVGPHARWRPLRTLAHLLVVGAGWIGFVWMWALVARQPWESDRLVWLIVGSLVVAPLVTGAWVMHNRALYRRKGARRAVAPADKGYPRDWHGRRVLADWPALCASPVVTISLAEDGIKQYLGVARARPAQPPRHAGADAASPWIDTLQ